MAQDVSKRVSRRQAWASAPRDGARQRRVFFRFPLGESSGCMANPVHVLVRPMIPPSRLLQTLKGFSARMANRLVDRTGEPFWQAESYDHWVRDGGEYGRIAAYIDNNPVKAGLVARAADYRWSSAGGRMSRHDCRDGRRGRLRRGGDLSCWVFLLILSG